jgi:hypothetical protein
LFGAGPQLAKQHLWIIYLILQEIAITPGTRRPAGPVRSTWPNFPENGPGLDYGSVANFLAALPRKTRQFFPAATI